MLALDQGGRCEAVLQRLPENAVEVYLDRLLQRQVAGKEALESVGWIDRQTIESPIRALVFYAHPAHLDFYRGALPLEKGAYSLARACGHWGSSVQYLYQTVSKLEEFGIDDENLWALQQLVADEIERHNCAIQTNP
jgi:cation transport protein ChaC